MPDLNRFSELRRALLLKGLPHTYVRKCTAELNEHWEDLREQAAQEGRSPAEAVGAASGTEKIRRPPVAPRLPWPAERLR